VVGPEAPDGSRDGGGGPFGGFMRLCALHSLKMLQNNLTVRPGVGPSILHQCADGLI
jgi:hypothetical protein